MCGFEYIKISYARASNGWEGFFSLTMTPIVLDLLKLLEIKRSDLLRIFYAESETGLRSIISQS